MRDKVRSFIRKYNMINEGDRIVAGVSGGADSIALLKILVSVREEMSLSLFVVHINHGIRDEAAEDALFVKGMCDKMKVPFFLFEENIPDMASREKCSEEEMGRIFRYECFHKVMVRERANKLAVAHHMDDQAETVLFHMARGTDLAGLSGMRPVSFRVVGPGASNTEDFYTEMNQGCSIIIRPLLCCRKKEICDWLEKQGDCWREDATNGDDSYSRNKIRVNVLPELEKINERAIEHITELSDRINEYDVYIGNQALSYINNAKDEGNIIYGGCNISINRNHLLKQNKILAERVLYDLLTDVSGAKKDIAGGHIRDILEIMRKQSGKSVNMPYGIKVYNSYEWTCIEKNESENPGEIREDILDISIDVNELEHEKEMIFELPDGGSIILRIESLDKLKDELLNNSEILQKNYTKYFDCDTIVDTLQIRYPAKEDFIVVDTGGHRKKIGKFFKDIKLPVKQRSAQVVVAKGHEVLWIVGKRRSESYRINPSTGKVLWIEYRPGK